MLQKSTRFRLRMYACRHNVTASGGKPYLAPPARSQTGSVHPALLVVLAVVLLAALLWLVRALSTPGAGVGGALTLDKIARTGTLTLGHRENSIPFSYFDNQQRVVGYSTDIARAVAEQLREELDLPGMEVKLVPVTSQTRIPLLINNTIDLECGTTTNNRVRGRQIAFSTNYFISGTRFLVRRDSGIEDLPDIHGRNVLVSAGTTSEIVLRRMNAQEQLGMRIVAARDHGDAFVALEFGKAVAFMSDEAILFGEMSKAKRPDDWHVVGTPLTKEVYACAMRRHDPEFKGVVDHTIEAMMHAGEMENLYRRWFQSPIPPRDVNLNVPLDPAMRELFAHPHDRPVE